MTGFTCCQHFHIFAQEQQPKHQQAKNYASTNAYLKVTHAPCGVCFSKNLQGATEAPACDPSERERKICKEREGS